MAYEIEITDEFDRWLKRLKDKAAVARIMSRIYRMESGNFGDVKSVGENLFEARLFFGPGYRLYYTFKGQMLVLLLCGGNKSTQAKDIAKAEKLKE